MTAKVWNVERAMLLRVFEEEHEEQVNHCQFTNTSHRPLLATCSNDKILNVKVWKRLFCFVFFLKQMASVLISSFLYIVFVSSYNLLFL